MTDKDLHALETLLKVITEGPWSVAQMSGSPLYGVLSEAELRGVAEACLKEDAEFIVAARTAIPELIAEIRRSRKQR